MISNTNLVGLRNAFELARYALPSSDTRTEATDEALDLVLSAENEQDLYERIDSILGDDEFFAAFSAKPPVVSVAKSPLQALADIVRLFEDWELPRREFRVALGQDQTARCERAVRDVARFGSELQKLGFQLANTFVPELNEPVESSPKTSTLDLIYDLSLPRVLRDINADLLRMVACGVVLHALADRKQLVEPWTAKGVVDSFSRLAERGRELRAAGLIKLIERYDSDQNEATSQEAAFAMWRDEYIALGGNTFFPLGIADLGEPHAQS